MNKHLIFTNGRSGSNYLVTLLNSHPQITNYGEVLGDWTLPHKVNQNFFGGLLFRDRADYLDYLYRSQLFFYASQLYSVYARLKQRRSTNFKFRNRLKSIGIKDFAIHFQRQKLTNYLQDRSDLRIIHLYRHNSLKRLISLQAMESTGVVKSVGDRKSAKPKLYLAPENTMQQLATFEREKQEQFEIVEAIPSSRVMNIAYEDYFGDRNRQQQINRQILDFLQVDQIELQGKHQKILDSSLPNTIENYDEIKELLEGTKYAQYLVE